MKSLSTKTEFLMTLSGKNVWQETEETHQEEIKIKTGGEVVRNAIKNYLMENVWKQTNVSLTFTMLTRFVCKKLKSLFLSCRLFIADPANLS